MCGLTKAAVERSGGEFAALRVGQSDPVPLNVGNPEQRIDYFRKLVRRNRTDGFLVITLPVQDNEFDPFHQANLPLVLMVGAHPQALHVAIDDMHGVHLTT
jgi:DNA-binding LacI/PurR family transcriptional regulator